MVSRAVRRGATAAAQQQQRDDEVRQPMLGAVSSHQPSLRRRSHSRRAQGQRKWPLPDSQPRSRGERGSRRLTRFVVACGWVYHTAIIARLGSCIMAGAAGRRTRVHSSTATRRLSRVTSYTSSADGGSALAAAGAKGLHRVFAAVGLTAAAPGAAPIAPAAAAMMPLCTVDARRVASALGLVPLAQNAARAAPL